MTMLVPEDIKKLYPFKQNFYSLSADGVRMHYIDEGAGVPIIMVHGNPTWSFFYRDVVKKLSAGFRCIVPDHIGCGLSDKPQHYDYSLETHIQNLKALIDHLGLKEFHIIVHDWGGPIGLSAALANITQLKKVVILNTAAFVSKRIPRRINFCRTPLLGELIIRGFNGFVWPASFMAVVKELPETVKKGFLFPYNSWKNRIAIHRFVQDIPLKPSHPSFQALQELDNNLHLLNKKPMFIAWGKQDFCFNDHFLAQWRERFPKALVREYPNAGHYLLEDAGADIIGRIKSFLEP